MKIVEVTKDDNYYIKDIINIEEETFGKNGGVDMWLLKPLIKYGKVLILVEEEKVLGVAEFMKDFDKEEVYIYGFAIGVNFRGRGYGGFFLEEIKKYMREKRIKKILLTVDPENKSAIHVYEKYGFKIIKLIKNEYGKEINRLYMECII